ncbi:MAG: hypothetical protein LH468_00695 [Nocardioides sp.]|nr:hypothetical protein [Nocardioides sp.]
MTRPSRTSLVLSAAVWSALVALLVLAAVTPGHFGDPAAAYRLVAYPLLALVLPAVHLLARTGRPVPAAATTLVTLPFLIDTIGNVADLYATISWWDDVNHVSNWLLLSGGIGLALVHTVRPPWALGVLVTGLGSALAVLWELGEWAWFYSAPYPGTLYEDTLGDQVLGTLGALVAGIAVAWLARGAAARSRTGR